MMDPRPSRGETVATIEVEGADRRSALEAGLCAVLALAVEAPRVAESQASGLSAPIRGEGVDLPALFADLVDDLITQIADFGAAIYDVRLDGVVRTEAGGLIGWGYVAVARPASPAATLPRLDGVPDVRDEGERGVVLRATVRHD